MLIGTWISDKQERDYADVKGWIMRYLMKVRTDEIEKVEALEFGTYVHKVLENREPASHDDVLGQTLLEIIPEYQKAEVQTWYNNVVVAEATYKENKKTGEKTLLTPTILCDFTIVLDNQINATTGTDYKTKSARHWTQEEADAAEQFDLYSWLTQIREWVIWSICNGATPLALPLYTKRSTASDDKIKKLILQALKVRDREVEKFLEGYNSPAGQWDI